MAIFPVPTSESKPVFQVQDRIAPERDLERLLRTPPGAAAPVDEAGASVRLGESGPPDIQAVQRMAIERILSRIESTPVGARARELFEAAGKSEFDAAFETAPLDTSPEATASRILEGITGYIYGAFQAQNPEVSEERLFEFRDQVMAGFERGLEDARDILTGLGAMDEELTASIDQTENIVRQGLADFFETAVDRLRRGADSGESADLLAPVSEA